MEIYANASDRRVYLDVPVTPTSDSMTVKIYKDGAVVHEVSTVSYLGGRYSITIPFFLSQEDSRLEVNWDFEYIEGGTSYTYNNMTYVDVVTPYVSIAEITALVDDDDFTEEDIKQLERTTRYIVNTHTGQMFGKYHAVRTVRSRGGVSLQMPEKLLRLNTVNGLSANPDLYSINAGGWYLDYFAINGIPYTKADYYGLHMGPNGVISNPNNVNPNSIYGRSNFIIDGMWGWDTVPSDVTEATRLLINDYAGGDSEYRDRYLTSMTAADWRIQFHAGAFSRTGNVRADQLLAPYVLSRGWAVL